MGFGVNSFDQSGSFPLLTRVIPTSKPDLAKSRLRPGIREAYASVRACLAQGFRYFISQKLTSRTDSSGLVPIVEIVRADVPTRASVAKWKARGKHPERLCASGLGGIEGLDGKTERLLGAGVVDLDCSA